MCARKTIGTRRIWWGSSLEVRAIRKKLARWYELNRRNLPWRSTRDPYAIWISEIMLQQTRVAAAIPYFERFIRRFPSVESLARAKENEVLTLWSGLGYYSRARNLLRAAREVTEVGDFPRDYEGILALPGIGTYTAAAIGSIAFGLPHAVVDGNVRRVVMRIANDVAIDVQQAADRLLDHKNPGLWNQAVMELGAMVCLPRDPMCNACPVSRYCEAQRHRTQTELPPKQVKPQTIRLDRTLLAITSGNKILVAPSIRVQGFWDLPEPFHGARVGNRVGLFRHSILNRQYHFAVHRATVSRRPRHTRWLALTRLNEFPLSTAAKKALRCLEDIG